MTRTDRRNLRTGLLFISPWIVGLTVFNLWPLLRSLHFSLCDYSVLNDPVFIGLDNYQDMALDKAFWKSLWNTLIYAAFALPTGVIVALALALLLNRDVIARPVLRAIIFVPSLIPLVAMAVLIRGMFNGDYGVINVVWEWIGGGVDALLAFLGLSAPEWITHGPNWLGDPKWMKPTLVLMNLYGVGGAVVIYLAGLQEVPRQMYEAADIDGASGLQKVWNITIPMISPVIYFNLIITTIFALQIFVQSYVVYDFNGGADRAAYFYTMHLINQGFVYLRMGYACAMAWVLFLLVAALTYIAHRLTERRVHYGGA